MKCAEYRVCVFARGRTRNGEKREREREKKKREVNAFKYQQKRVSIKKRH